MVKSRRGASDVQARSETGGLEETKGGKAAAN